MRVVWKDSKPKNYKPVKYRNDMIYGSPEGWSNNIPDDDNLYATHYDALNEIVPSSVKDQPCGAAPSFLCVIKFYRF